MPLESLGGPPQATSVASHLADLAGALRTTAAGLEALAQRLK